MSHTATPTLLPAVTAEVANHVLYHFGAGGYRPGSFTVSLLEAIGRSDGMNRNRLRCGFPEYVQAFEVAERYDDGIAALQARAQPTQGDPFQ